MDRLDYYFRQKVTEAELDDGFAKAEAAMWNMVVDADLVGVHFGLAVSEQGVPDMTVLVTAGAAYDATGRRIRVPSNQNVNCAVDFNSISTAVASGGNQRWLSVFAGFQRNLTDPRTDGNALTVYFSRAETFEFRVVAGTEAATGLAARPALDSSRILVCDILLSFGTSSITNSLVSTSRRQDVFASTVSPITVQTGRVKTAISALVTQLAAHVNSTTAHAAANITYAGGSTWGGVTNPATTVEAQLDKIITDLANSNLPDGATLVGFSALAATRVPLSFGSVRSAVLAVRQYAEDGPAGFKVNTYTSNQTIDATQRQVYVDTSGGAVSLQLPAPVAGRSFYVKDKTGNFGTNACTLVRAASEKIEGVAASRVLSAPWGSYRVHSDGTDWYID